MKYNDFGKSGVKISSLGFGCMRFPMLKINGNEVVDQDKTSEMMLKSFELGVNYYDTAWMYCNGLSEEALGKALKPFRSKVMISTKSPGWELKGPGDARKLMEEQLRRLDTDYVDFYHFHAIGYDFFFDTEKKTKWLEDVQKAKEEGMVKHISFSFHDDPKNMLKLIDTGYFETLLCQYNAIDRSNEAGMAYAKSKGLGVVVMGPLGGGRVSGMPKEVAAKLGINVASSAELALRFVLSNPNVDCAISGMQSLQMLEENVKTATNTTPLDETEINAINRMMAENAKLAELYCTGYAYCIPCPSEVNIPEIFKLMNYKKIYGIDEFSKDGYAAIGTNEWVKGNRADSCIECGICETKCPQKLPIMEQLKESHRALAR